MKKDLNYQFLEEISKSEADSFFGILKILGIKLLKDDHKTPKEFTQMLDEAMDKYSSLNRKVKKEILKVLRDANRAENSEEKRHDN